jgi:glycosyltransferase involved in cell wall biosynthesis
MAVLSVVHYSADPWEHVCPILRFTAPARLAGLTPIQGNDWDADQQIRINPELVRQADAVLIQRDFPRYRAKYEEIMALAHQLGKPVVYEIDDLLFGLPAEHPDSRHYELARPMILQAALEADAVTCTSESMRQALAPFNSNIQILPNYLHDAFWNASGPRKPEREADHQPLVIGYMGGHSHAPDLEMLAPVLEQVLERYAGRVMLRCWGVKPPESLLARPEVEFIDIKIWSYAEFCRFFSAQQVDIGIAPLCDHIFNQCKSSIKYLEYAFLGIPSVYSRVGPYRSAVRDEQNGFLAGSPQEWEQHLSELIEQPELRAALSAAAYEEVMRSGLLSQHNGEWSAFYSQLRPASPKTYPAGALQALACKTAEWHADLEERLSQQMELVRQGKDLTAQAWEYHGRDLETINQLNVEIYQLKARIGQEEQLRQTQSRQLQATILEQQEAGHIMRAELTQIKSSNTYALAMRLSALGHRLAPEGGRRQRLVQSGLNGIRLVRREGMGSFWRRLGQKTRRGDGAGASPADPTQAGVNLQVHLVSGKSYPPEVLSVVAIQAADQAEPDLQGLRAWAGQQTWQVIELVLWDRGRQQAIPLDADRPAWDAPDFSGLCAGLMSSFIAFDGPDLRTRDGAYLESSLAALISEDLAFTLNLDEGEGDVGAWLAQKSLPGSEAEPFLGALIRKDCLDGAGNIVLAGRPASVAGRIIRHAAPQGAREPLPLRACLVGAELSLAGRRIVIPPAGEGATPGIDCPLYPLDLALVTLPQSVAVPTVLIASQYFATGGAEYIALNLMDGLAGKARFIVVSLEPQDASLGSTEGDFRRITPYVYAMPEFVDPLVYLSFLNYLVARFEPGCFYIANGTPWLYDMLPDFRSLHQGLAIVNQVYDHQLGPINRYRPELVACIDAHIASNQRIHAAYEKRGVKPGDIFDIVNGVNPEEYRPGQHSPPDLAAIRARLGIPDGVRVVTFMARLHPQKRPLDFIELARRFEGDAELFFLMVGSGSLEDQVEAQAVRAGLKKFKHQPFYRPSRDVFAVSDVLVLTSEYEGMPMAVIEALASGVPVLATDVGNVKEILELTGGGVIVPGIGDIGGLCEGLRKLLAAPPDLEAVREAVIQHYSIQTMAESYWQVFQRGKHA